MKATKTQTARKANTGKGKAPRKPVRTEIPYGGKNGAGEAKPIKGGKRFGIAIAQEPGRTRYTAKYGKAETRLGGLIRCMGATGYAYREADQFLADHGLPGLSLNTLKSQLHSGATAGAMKPKDFARWAKQLAESGTKKGNPLHHGIPSKDDLKVFGPVLKKALAYYRERIVKASRTVGK